MKLSIDLLKKKLSSGTLEVIVQSNGTICIGREDEHKWLHELYFPCSPQEINEYEKKSNIFLPSQIKKLLNIINGGTFYKCLSICGIRKYHSRALTVEAMYQPHDIFHEQISIPRSFKEKGIFLLGGYSNDGSEVLFMPNGEVSRKNRTTWLEIDRWDNIEDFIIKEIDRMKNIPPKTD